MLIIVCGLKGSGKSVALEILEEQKYKVFNVDKWIRDIYNYGEIGYAEIRKKLGEEFVDLKGVSREKLRQWILDDYSPENKINQNLLKLNNIVLPIIKKKMVELSKEKLIFVEMAIFLNHHELFRDVCDGVIYIQRDNLMDVKPGSAAWYLCKEILPNWKIVENNSNIDTLSKNLTSIVDIMVEKHIRKKFHINTQNIE